MVLGNTHVSSRALAALLLAITLMASPPMFAKDNGVIILRLEDGGRTGGLGESRERVPETPISADSNRVGEIAPLDECPVIVVPPCSDRPARLPDVSKAGSAVLMDAETGQIIFQKNAHTRRPNASTTKIMTAILLIENVGMDQWITASKKASLTPYTSIHLKPGEKIQARDLLMGLMIRSANDAAVAIAEHVGGSTSKFAAMMNRKAREIGCKDTHFVTPNGLYAKDHYSSAYDLCLMARYAFRYPIFNEVISTRKHVLSSRTMNREDLAVFAKHRFMKNYSGADGVKSGYIRQAGYCLVGSATRDGWRLVAAVLKSDDSARDTAALMDYGFNGFRPYTIAKADTACAGAAVDGGAAEKVRVAPAKDLKVIVPRTGARIVTRLDLKPLEAPITKGTPVGTVVVSVNGVDTTPVELRAAEDLGISMARRVWWLTKAGVLLVAVVAGMRYGTAFTKGARRRGRRVTAPLRGVDRFR